MTGEMAHRPPARPLGFVESLRSTVQLLGPASSSATLGCMPASQYVRDACSYSYQVDSVRRHALSQPRQQAPELEVARVEPVQHNDGRCIGAVRGQLLWAGAGKGSVHGLRQPWDEDRNASHALQEDASSRL